MTLLSPLFNQLSPLGVAAGIPRGVESNYALGFDGVNDLVSASDTGFPSGTAVRTVSMWVKCTTTSECYFFSYGTSSGGNQRYSLGVNVGGIAGVFGVEINGNDIHSTRAINDGRWHHVVAVVDGSNSHAIYIDGKLETTKTMTTSTTLAGTLYVGRNVDSGGFYFPGFLDDVRIYNIALTADQVSQIYNNSLPPPTTGLVGYWNFEEGTGTSTADQSGNGNNGTLVGGPTWQPQTPPRLIRDRNNEDWGLGFVAGSSQSVNIGDLAITDFGLNNFAVSFWVKGGNNSAALITKDSIAGGNNGLYIYVGGGGGSYRCFASPNEYVFGTNDGAWHNLCLVRTGTGAGQLELYYDGRLSATGIDARNLNNSRSLLFGCFDGGTEFLTGQIKDVRIYNSALPLTSIQKLSRGIEPSETPIARWRLNEGTGITANDSIGTNHGTLTNGPTWTGDIPQWFRQTIESSQALSLDGVNDYVDVGAGIDALIQDDMTLTTWIKPAAVALIASNRGPVATAGWEFVTDGSAKLLVQNSVGGYMTASTAVGSTNIWNAATFTRSGASYHIYLNGVLDDSADKANVSGSLGSTSPLLIGKNGRTGSVMNGLVDDVCIYNRALSAAEIADAAAGFLVTAGLVSRLKLDGNANDSVGSNHGTEQGGVGYSTNVPGTL